jgi:putative SOS response-associated peptidase YedK
MCGRVILTLSQKMIDAILNEEFDVNDLNIDNYVPRYNVGPGTSLLSVIQHKEAYRVGYMKWNFIPSYAKDETSGYKFINARSETIFAKPSFADAFEKRRCLVICNGFYEWNRSGQEKIPHFFYRDKDQAILLGAIWNPYIQKDGSKNYGISLITTEANEVMAPIHHRMPVVIPFNKKDEWFSGNLDALKTMMKPIDNDYLKTYQVSNLVNSIKNDSIENIKRASS